MRRVLFALAALLAGAGSAHAACEGEDLFAALQANEPAVAEELLAKADEVPFGEGRFWRVSKPGVADSYVLGTYHIAQAVDLVPKGTWQALEGARIAIFEIALEEQLEVIRLMSSDPTLSLAEDPRPFADRFSGRDLALVRLAFGARGVQPEVAERLRPWMQFSLLAFPPCQIELIDTGPEMLDLVLARRAEEAGVAQMGLEDPVEAVSMIDRMSPELRDQLMVAAVRLAALEESAFETAISFYRDGRIALVPIFNEWLVEREAPELDVSGASDELYRALLDGRNAKWLPTLLPEVEEGGAFIAVGALHLIGENGLMAAFDRAGFTLERLDAPAD